jgi:hypothetical protein
MRLVQGFVGFASWVGVVLVCSAVALPGCDSKNNSDDDDDSGSSGQAGAGDPGASCDSSHKCGTGLSCVSGVCTPNSGTGGTGGTGSLPPGTLGGSCKSGETCDSGLRCYTGICIPDSVGSGGSGATEGTLAGPCYPNDTCNAGLSCLSGYCLPETSVGGSGGGGTGGVSSGGSAQGGSGGTGGSARGGSGGSLGGTGGSLGGTGGSGGGTGGGGTGGGSGSSGTPSTHIVAADGLVVDGSNTVGIVGPWYVFVDQYSSIVPLPNEIDFADAGDQICVSGIVRQSDEFGPTLALNLNQPDLDGDPLGYVPAEHGVTGFSFAISGTYLPSKLQITYAGLDGSQYCAFTSATSASLSFSQTILDCWNGSGATGSTSTSYATLQFQLPVNYHADGQVFDFCITSLTALTN